MFKSISKQLNRTENVKKLAIRSRALEIARENSSSPYGHALEEAELELKKLESALHAFLSSGEYRFSNMPEEKTYEQESQAHKAAIEKADSLEVGTENKTGMIFKGIASSVCKRTSLTRKELLLECKYCGKKYKYPSFDYTEFNFLQCDDICGYRESLASSV